LKRILLMAVMLLTLLLTLPVSATPYTEAETEEFMQAIYCEPVWTEDYPVYWVQFIDVDLDGRKELLSVEAGEPDAPKQAHAYAFVDAELGHRGFLTIGRLDVCRDTETGESFMINRLGETVERLKYDPETMLISAHTLSDNEVQRLESYGYDPVIVTKAQRDTVKVYEDCQALFLPAYLHNDYTNGIPPMAETYDYEKAPPVSQAALWLVIAVVAAATVTATVVLIWVRRVRAPR